MLTTLACFHLLLPVEPVAQDGKELAARDGKLDHTHESEIRLMAPTGNDPHK